MSTYIKKIIRNLFTLGVYIKGVNGIIELFSGFFLIVIKNNSILHFIQTIFSHELVEDPKDKIANFLINSSQNVSKSSLFFVAIYLIIHGLIKILIFFGLQSKNKEVYLMSGLLLLLLIIYEVYKLINNHSILLLFLILIDVSILILLKLNMKQKEIKII